VRFVAEWQTRWSKATAPYRCIDECVQVRFLPDRTQLDFHIFVKNGADVLIWSVESWYPNDPPRWLLRAVTIESGRRYLNNGKANECRSEVDS